MQITLNKVFLQYRGEGEKGPYGPVHKNEAYKFVALDLASGGYPCSTSIEYAHDFKTVAEAQKYLTHFEFEIREVTVTYSF